MEKMLGNEVTYYYDTHSTEEDLMGQTASHATLVYYLLQVLHWLFRGQTCAIHMDLNFYQTTMYKEYPLAPDVAVIKGVAYSPVSSWRVGITGPAPQVVFEIASQETWEKDLVDKPSMYAKMGVKEYFAYDPHEPPVWRRSPSRLRGWRVEERGQDPREIEPDEAGHLWSQELASWLVPDEAYLRLYDAMGQLRLTADEAWMQKSQVLEQKSQIFEQKLRELGINPDEL